ncbi:MAG: SARP family transcriptional regulator, partial [Chloroflexia bacterium]|nr:SARP family transcriptional regulator [Chloroflexia bacterium]
MSGPALLLLGPPRIERGGDPVELDTRKALALAAYVAVTRQRASRDVLAALLWPDSDEARAALRRTLSVLNKALGEGCLDVDREHVGLNWQGNLWVDVDHFQRRLSECRSHGHPGDEACLDCLVPLESAAALYRNDFLAGFTLRDSPEFDDWQFFQAEGLRRELGGALERLTRLLARQGRFEESIAYARRWLALDSLHEPAHRALMELFAWAGQRTAALRQYELCLRVLTQELDVPPLASTSQLYHA